MRAARYLTLLAKVGVRFCCIVNEQKEILANGCQVCLYATLPMQAGNAIEIDAGMCCKELYMFCKDLQT